MNNSKPYFVILTVAIAATAIVGSCTFYKLGLDRGRESVKPPLKWEAGITLGINALPTNWTDAPITCSNAPAPIWFDQVKTETVTNVETYYATNAWGAITGNDGYAGLDFPTSHGQYIKCPWNWVTGFCGSRSICNVDGRLDVTTITKTTTLTVHKDNITRVVSFVEKPITRTTAFTKSEAWVAVWKSNDT